MKTWDLFLKDVLPKVPGCPEPVAEHAIKRAAQEFFGTTRLWCEWLDAVTTRADVREYDIELPSRSILVRLERATLDGRDIPVHSEAQLPSDWVTYPDTLGDGIHTTDRQGLVVLPTPAADLVLRVQASLKPSEDALGIEDHLFAHYVMQIADGAVAALKSNSGTSYADADGSMLHRGRFLDHMAVASFQRFRGHSSALPRRRVQTF